MLIAELKGVQDIKQSPVGVAAAQLSHIVNTSSAWQKFCREMAKLGFKRLGTGSYGVVFERPDYPWVFKVFKNDPGYLTYINYAIQHQNLSAVPKIKGKPICIDKPTYVVRIEKLYPLAANMSELKDAINRSPFDLKNLKDTTYKKFVSDIHKKWPNVAKVLTDLSSINNDKFYADLHGGNIMQRADGTPVITDPFST